MNDGAGVLSGNAAHYLFEICTRPEYVDSPAYFIDDRAIPFRTVHARSCKVANLLRRLGVAPGDRIALSILDGADFPAVLVGALIAGVIPVPMNTYLKKADYLYYLQNSEAKALFIDQSLVPILADARAHVPGLRDILVVGQGTADLPSLDDAIANEREQASLHQCSADEPAFILYSSGSTGSPKGVVHTHADVYWSMELFGIRMQQIQAGDVIQCPPKMFFAYGLNNQVFFPLRAAASVCINPLPSTAERLWRIWARHRPTIVMSVPTLFAGMLQMAENEIGIDTARAAMHRTRFCVSGGEALPPSLYQRWKETTGTEILDAAGTTETLHMFLMNRPGEAIPGSCGRPVEGCECLVVNNDGEEMPVGEVGNLLVRTPAAAREYWRNPERTAQIMRFGGVLTGDKFYRDKDNNFFLVGRTDDMLRVGGVWVSPIEIESTLCRHDMVLECAVVGAPDEHMMLKPKAFVVTKSGRPPGANDAEILKEFCRRELAHIKCPRWIEFVEELPKTATGKIQRYRLRDAAKPTGT